MAWSNYDDVIAQLHAAGLAIERPEIGGTRPHRCAVDGERGKPGWYILHEVILDSGDALLAGAFGVWSGADNNAQKIEVREKARLTAEQRASLRKRLAEDRRKAEAARKRDEERAAAAAKKAWQRCEPTGESAYLAKKGVHAHGVRFSPSGALAIPLIDTSNRIRGLQIVRPPNDSRRLGKEFWPAGVAVRGHFHLIGAPRLDGVLLITEGYATGASLHEATGLPVAITFSANNLAPVAVALRKRYKLTRFLFCADDDRLQKCRHCKARLVLPVAKCASCGQPHGATNAGIISASAAALESGGEWVRPAFADEEEIQRQYLKTGRKQTDFNDLHAGEGLHVVREQIEARLGELGWNRAGASRPGAEQSEGGGDAPLLPIDSVDELLERFALVYGMGGTVFDQQEHCLLTLSDMRDACMSKYVHRAWAEHPERKLVRPRDVGFDPGGTDPAVKCNLWGGWETRPEAGDCERLLELLSYMCNGEGAGNAALHDWVLKWLAYPIQHPGAKMKTALVMHGPQGVGKNMFFEAIMAIYGRYGRVIDQNALEDKFNDWASRKLFLLADEVIARSDLYHVKNKLKSFITGDWIRINPKGMQAYDERNHANLVFLSNEAMPVAIEEDDRRHAVVWTPPELSRAFYADVKYEIDQGGVAALHHHLLHLDLGDFTPATRPPITNAKSELIKLGLDSSSRFFYALDEGEIDGIKPRPALSSDVFLLYRTWCKRTGTPSTSLPKLVNALDRKHGVKTERKRYFDGVETVGPRSVMYLGKDIEPPPGKSELGWLTEHIDTFRRATNDYCGGIHA